MRTIKELLQLMLDNQDKFESGLCSWRQNLRWFDEAYLTNDENELLCNYIKQNRPSKWSSMQAFLHSDDEYYWKYGDIKPRIKWIKEHIKKN